MRTVGDNLLHSFFTENIFVPEGMRSQEQDFKIIRVEE